LTPYQPEHRDFIKPTAVTPHLIATRHDVKFDDVKTLSSGTTDIEL